MNDTAIIYVAIAVGIALFVIAYVLIDEFFVKRPKRQKEYAWDPIGYIDSVSENDGGIEISGRVFPGSNAYEVMTKGALEGLSIGPIPIRDRTSKIQYMEKDEMWCTGNQTSGGMAVCGSRINHVGHVFGLVQR
jgi:hypothetical protein